MRIRNFVVLSILLAGLTVSGCAGPKEKAPTDRASSTTIAVTPSPSGDIMESEIATIESDISEIEALLRKMDEVQDISFRELEGLNF